MNKTIWEWMSKDAEWYHFWLPRSGFVGGVMMGFLIGGTVIFFLSVTGCAQVPTSPHEQDSIPVQDSVHYPTLGNLKEGR